MLYAHWEGYLRNVLYAYGEYVTEQREPYKDLKRCFLAFALKAEVDAVTGSEKLSVAFRLLQVVEQKQESRANLNIKRHLERIGNLDYTRLSALLEALGLRIPDLETKRQLIDESLLGMRNRIAHGEDLSVDFDTIDVLQQHIIGLMRSSANEVVNSAAGKLFKLS